MSKDKKNKNKIIVNTLHNFNITASITQSYTNIPYTITLLAHMLYVNNTTYMFSLN